VRGGRRRSCSLRVGDVGCVEQRRRRSYSLCVGDVGCLREKKKKLLFLLREKNKMKLFSACW